MIAVLIRHAQAASAGLLAGRLPGMSLTDTGRGATIDLARRMGGLNIAALYTSPRQRASETALALSRTLGIQAQVDEAFDELDYGEWSGKRIDEMDRSLDPRWRAFNERRDVTRPPLGEWMIEAQVRCVSRLRSFATIHSSSAVGIVTHADIIRAIVAYCAGVSLNHVLRIRIPPASVTIVSCRQRAGGIDAEVLALNSGGRLLA